MNERIRASMRALLIGPLYTSVSVWLIVLLLGNVAEDMWATWNAAKWHPATSAIVRDGFVGILAFLVAGALFLISDLKKFRALAQKEKDEELRDLLFESTYRVIIMSVIALGLLSFGLWVCQDFV